MDIEQISKRIADPALQSVAVKSVGVANKFAARVAEINANKALTAIGKTDAINAELPAAIRELAKEARPLQSAKAKVAVARDAIKVPALAKDDIVGFMADSEYRALFRGMDRAERARLLLKTNDAGLLASLLRAAPELSGIDPHADEQFAKTVEQRYFRLTAGDKIDQLDEADSQLAEVDAFAAAARGKLRSMTEMDARQFDLMARPIEDRVGAPWIKRDGSRVMRIDTDADGLATYRDATPAEIEAGVEYADFAAYNAARAPSAAA